MSQKQAEWKRAVAILFPLCLVWVWLFVHLGYPRFLSGQNDFLAFYIGAKLLPQGQLYDVEANYALQAEIASIYIPQVLYTRPPFYAVFMLPLSLLPYRVAFWTFEALSFLALYVFVYFFQRRMKYLPWWCGISISVVVLLLNGQDDAFLLMLFAIALELLRRDRDFAAGLVLSLCSYKFHLFLLVPVVLLWHRRWRIAAGGAAGGAALAVLSFLVAGVHWPRQQLALVTGPDVNPATTMMGNLRAVVLRAPSAGPWLEVAAYVAVLALFLWIVSRERDLEAALGWALVGGLLVGMHSWIHDFVLLLAAVPLITAAWPVWPRRLVQTVLLLPVLPYGLLFPEYSYLLPVALVVVMASAAVSYVAVRKSPRAVEQPVL